MADPLAQALAVLRSHADVCSRYGEPDRLRAEADRIESLAGVAAGPQATPGQVLWEGDLGELMHAVNGTRVMSALVDAFPDDEPGQWQVRIQRVVAVPTDPTEDQT